MPDLHVLDMLRKIACPYLMKRASLGLAALRYRGVPRITPHEIEGRMDTLAKLATGWILTRGEMPANGTPELAITALWHEPRPGRPLTAEIFTWWVDACTCVPEPRPLAACREIMLSAVCPDKEPRRLGAFALSEMDTLLGQRSHSAARIVDLSALSAHAAVSARAAWKVAHSDQELLR